ncbi:helix-turn-helix domain-containing protein [Prescottella equi]|uniref:helix-turn-helix domain-containing protein n=1 Tax=Rhodococcus hoagii TaxID=43767 RepID=UPI00384F1350
MTDPVRVAGVILDDDTVAFLAATLRVLIRVLDEQSRRPVPRVFSLERQLTCSANSSVPGTTQHGGQVVRAISTPKQLDTDTAAAVLGCTPENVRALCRRGSLQGQRIGGRWVISADAVHERAAERKDSPDDPEHRRLRPWS